VALHPIPGFGVAALLASASSILISNAKAIAITGVELFDRFMLCGDLLDGQSG